VQELSHSGEAVSPVCGKITVPSLSSSEHAHNMMKTIMNHDSELDHRDTEMGKEDSLFKFESHPTSTISQKTLEKSDHDGKEITESPMINA
jgi:hypothetical protein